jgi:ABC-type transporter Mla MlaB component
VVRITQLDDPAATLRVEGTLNRGSIETLALACRAPLARGRAVRVDLSGVAFVDPAAVSVLRALVREGIRLVGCSALVRHLLRETLE